MANRTARKRLKSDDLCLNLNQLMALLVTGCFATGFAPGLAAEANAAVSCRAVWQADGLAATPFLRAAQKYDPRYEELLNQLPAVHAFDEAPALGGVNKEHRGTIHYALGSLVASHGWADWSKKRYAVVRPLRNIINQVANINAYDTYTVGPTMFGPGDIIVGPESDRHLFPETVQYLPSYSNLREAVRRAIDQMSGIHLDLNDDSGLDGNAIDSQGVNANTPAFFAPIFAHNPQISFGTHIRSSIGVGGYWGNIDQLTRIMGGSDHAATTDVKFLRLFASELMNDLVRFYSEVGASKPFMDAVFQFQKVLNHRLWIVDFDLKLRSQYSFRLADVRKRWMTSNDTAAIQKEMADLESKIKAVADVPEAKRSGTWWQVHEGEELRANFSREFTKSDPGQWDENSLPDLFTTVRWPDVVRMFPAVKKLLPKLNLNNFMLEYGPARMALVGIEQAEREGLIAATEKSIRKLMQTKDPMWIRETAIMSAKVSFPKPSVITSRDREKDIRQTETLIREWTVKN